MANIQKMHESDACYDINSINKQDIEINPNEWKLINTGIILYLPKNHEAQIRPRSGLALKHGITVLNTPGTIDSGYRGEIKIFIINHGKEKFIIKPYSRIAQIIIKELLNYELVETTSEDDLTDRQDKGFGSTEH